MTNTYREATAPESIYAPQKVEVVRADSGFLANVFTGLFMLALTTLIVWWAVAVWFPELGLTYWQLVLPVYAYRVLNSSVPLNRRFKVDRWKLKVRRL